MDARPQKYFFKNIIRKVFLEDWVMKLVALAITLALWLGVTGLSKPTTQRLTEFTLRLNYSNNIEVTNSPIQEVDLVVSGDRRKLAQINKGAYEVSIDISEVPPGDRVIPLTPETVVISPPLPTGVRLDEVQPRSMAVRIEAVETRAVPVKPDTFGELPAGFEVYDEVVNPPKVTVRGPAGFVRTLESVHTERIDLTGLTSDFTARQIPISVSNPKAIVGPELVVDVTFKIGEQRVERVFHVPIGDGSGRRADVRLFGGRSLFQNLRVTDLKIEVDKNGDPDDSARVILPTALEGKVEIRKVDLRN